MTTKIIRIITGAVFVCVALVITGILVLPVSWNQKKSNTAPQTRVIIPQTINLEEIMGETAEENLARADQLSVKVPLEAGETVAAVLTEDFDGDSQDEQFVVYRNLLEAETPMYLTYIDYDGAEKAYRQIWNAQTGATRPGTVSVYTQDLTGDRSLCVLVSGMNGNGEHTLTVFRKINHPETDERAPSYQPNQPERTLFAKIAELRIDGSIQIRETARSQAYQLGMANGVSFPIAAYGRDRDSSNIMDQLEYVYTFNAGTGVYEQSGVTKIPGVQIEQRKVQELLGSSAAFEQFVSGLWYYVSPQGTIDNRQYIYFDPQSKEIIFYGDETQQVFRWQNSSASRFGLHINSQNISVTTLRRSIDIELESLESIRIKVFEDVRLKIGVNAPWDGSYRKAGAIRNAENNRERPDTHIDAVYDSPAGRFRFFSDGSYEVSAEGTLTQGKYAFFHLNNEEILELRSTEKRSADSLNLPIDSSNSIRETYLVENTGNFVEGEENPPGNEGEEAPRKSISLYRVRLGVRGIERLRERSITLNLAEES